MVDFSSWSGWIFFGLRLLLAVLGALVVYFISSPLINLLFRLAYPKKKISPTMQSLGRLTLGCLCGALIFIFAPIGGGGSGWGWGGGGGGVGPGGSGPGTGSGAGEGKGTAKELNPGKTDKEKTSPAAQPLIIEMIVSERYQKRFEGTEAYYLLGAVDPPKTLADVEAFLKENKAKISAVKIVTYLDTAAPNNPITIALQMKAQEVGIRCDEIQARKENKTFID